ncbi:GntR family transcriptional regulator [Kineosporia succinea]|uniref:DNA-binding FadR family transcriptional regulator n=1 Tax=Kineosporia succinea TaxID=84632 RepID=A0ABT9PDH0_9ACTN|nr:GntR family transcriptional regulator [Kineosporia succinea]MDP9830444.1 DNA-binding FadR family transcriptional regulator [Kineosporia succinea]
MSDISRLADQIAARIQAGRYRPGQRLPGPGDLEQAGHSGPAVREALRCLVEQGWAELGPDGGYVVTEP